MNKTKLIEALHAWIRQRPGLDPRNYIRDRSDKDGHAAYQSDSRSITRDRHEAETLLRYVELRDSITAKMILEASKHAFSGRLTIEPLNDGEGFSISYCTGGYWPIEYRRAVCSILASVVWDWLRDDMPEGIDNRGDYLRAAARRELGRTIANRWLS